MQKRKTTVLTLLLCLLCAGCAIAEEAGPDIGYLLALQGVRESAGGWLTAVMQFFTALGEAAPPMLVASALFWAVDERAGVRVLLFNAVGHVVNQFLKITCCVYRPWIRDARITPVPAAMTTATGYSFPSGHTVNAGAWTMGLGGCLKEKCAKKGGRIAVMAASTAVWLLVGFSRNFLGVHTPQDVGVMILLMLPLMYLCEKALAWAEKGGRRELIFSGACALLAVALAVYASCKSYPVDYDASGALLVDPALMIRDTFTTAGLMLGFAAGWLCSRRWIRFDRKGALGLRILRALIGCAVLLGAELLLKKPFTAALGAQWGRFALAALEALIVLALYPLCIRAVQARQQKNAAVSG